MSVNEGTGQGDLGSDGGFDINQVLGTSPAGETAGTQGDLSQAAQGSNEANQSGQKFKFGGRDWDSQEAADKEYRKILGKYGDQNGILNKLKSALKDPNDIAQLSRDPAWAEILAKLGIQNAAQEIDERQAREQAASPKDWDSYRSEFDVERHQFRLEREQWRFEKQLGRDLKREELNAVWGVIESAPSLTFEQAYKLAHHDQLLKEAATKAQNPPRNARVNRPAPPPGLVAGKKLDLSKPSHLQTKDEAREAMRRDIPRLLAESQGK